MQVTTLPDARSWPARCTRSGGYRARAPPADARRRRCRVRRSGHRPAPSRRDDDRAGWRSGWSAWPRRSLVYALDFWEHAPGWRCVAWRGRRSCAACSTASRLLPRRWAPGPLLGVAVTMRNEALVYTLVAVGRPPPCCCVRRRSAVAGGRRSRGGRRWRASPCRGSATSASSDRSAASTGRARGQRRGERRAGGGVGDRVREAADHPASPCEPPSCRPDAARCVGVLAGARRRRWCSPPGGDAPDRPACSGGGGGGARTWSTRHRAGWAFVPGLFAAAPAGAGGPGHPTPLDRTARATPVVVAPSASLPARVGLRSTSAGRCPQWGGSLHPAVVPARSSPSARAALVGDRRRELRRRAGGARPARHGRPAAVAGADRADGRRPRRSATLVARPEDVGDRPQRVPRPGGRPPPTATRRWLTALTDRATWWIAGRRGGRRAGRQVASSSWTRRRRPTRRSPVPALGGAPSRLDVRSARPLVRTYELP